MSNLVYLGDIKNEVDRAWLAGIIEGEGCIALHKLTAGCCKGGKYVSRRDEFEKRLEIVNTSEILIQNCKRILQVGNVREIAAKEKLRKRFQYVIIGKACERFLSELYPYFTSKKQEIRLVYWAKHSGDEARICYESLKLLHAGKEALIDFPDPPSMYGTEEQRMHILLGRL